MSETLKCLNATEHDSYISVCMQQPDVFLLFQYLKKKNI